MYVDILSSALDEWVTDLAGPELIEYAVLCRDELRAVAPPHASSADSAYTALAAEIAYDRALIAICTEHGIYAHATTFAYPMEERKRIEALLVEEGIDLDSPQLRRSANPVAPGPYPASAVAEQSGTDSRRFESGCVGPCSEAIRDKALGASSSTQAQHRLHRPARFRRMSGSGTSLDTLGPSSPSLRLSPTLRPFVWSRRLLLRCGSTS